MSRELFIIVISYILIYTIFIKNLLLVLSLIVCIQTVKGCSMFANVLGTCKRSESQEYVSDKLYHYTIYIIVIYIETY